MTSVLKFLNDVIKPWDELNNLLIERYAVEPELSSITKDVSSISNAINHQVDALAFEQKIDRNKAQEEVINASRSVRIISDVSDCIKHVELRKDERRNRFYVAAMFEVNEKNEFCFLRNGIFIEHATLGNHDFMQTSHEAIDYWNKKRGLSIQWHGSVRCAETEFFPEAFLEFNPKYCIEMKRTRFKCFRRNNVGELEPFAPENVKFSVYENINRI
jgi:hypothetical protein